MVITVDRLTISSKTQEFSSPKYYSLLVKVARPRAGAGSYQGGKEVGITKVGPTCYNMVHGSPVAKLPCFAPPQSFLKRFALRWWQLKCRFAASSAPKLQHCHPPTRPASAFTSACKHCCTGINLMLSRPNCPVLNPWAKL